MSDFLMMRKNMVKGQVLPENVVNPLLIDALFTIPREQFVPCQLARIGYMDAHFPLKKDRFLLRPATLARLLEALNPQSSDNILYVGAGTGYGPALLNHLAAHIVALDSEEALTQEAERLVKELNLSSIEVVLGPLIEGWENASPYDKIFIEGCVNFIPIKIASQLQEGGQLITIKQDKRNKRVAAKIEKKQGIFTEIHLFDAFAPRLMSFQEQKTFVF
jgi:protein-L-isoaspartate(D-aspartate) O-methyltransferase